MSALEFVASLVSSLAWPVAVLVIAVIFRAQIRQVMSRPLRRLRAGPVEMEFDRLLSEVEVAVQRPVSATPAEEPTKPGHPAVAELEELVTTSPVAAILDAHALIERELRGAVVEADPSVNVSRMTMGQLLRVATDKQILTPEAARAVRDLTVMRNLVAHGRASEVTGERARSYVTLADGVLSAANLNRYLRPQREN